MRHEYQIVRSLRRGGVAEILEADVVGEHGFVRRVALKRLLPIYASDADARRAFIDEGRIATNLDHPNIVRIVDFGTIDGQPHLALELIDGLDLVQIAGRVHFPKHVALFVAIETLRALEYAHDAVDDGGRALEIVHRDVTPANVLVSYAGVVKLTDFGIARAADRMTQTRHGITKGTAAFMAPEQARGDAVDRRSDVYAVGALLHWMVAGTSPLEDDDVRRTHQAGALVHLDPAVHGPLAEVVQRAMAFSPADRYESASAMADALWPLMTAGAKEDVRRTAARFMTHVRTLSNGEPPPVTKKAIGDLFDPALFRGEPNEALDYSDRTRPVVKGSFEEDPAPTERGPAPLPFSPGPTVVVPTLKEAPTDVEERETDPIIQEEINGFVLEDVIHEGRSGTSYLGQHPTLPLQRCVKIFSAVEDDEAVHAALLEDARILSQLEHPNVAPSTDFGRLADCATYLAMPLIQGRALDVWLEANGPLPPARAGVLLQQIADGLAAMHEKGLVHAALEPRHVLVADVSGRAHATIVGVGAARISKDPSERNAAADLRSLRALAALMQVEVHFDEALAQRSAAAIADALEPPAAPSAPPAVVSTPTLDHVAPRWPLAVALVSLIVVTAVITAWLLLDVAP